MTAIQHDAPVATTFNRRIVASGLSMVGVLGTIAGAWGFELIGHYLPCHLCLLERIPYYIGIPVAVGAFVFSFRRKTDLLARILLVILAALFIWSITKGVYHAGVEWHWWAGPADCTAGATGPRTGLLSTIQTTHIVLCDEAAWRFPNNWGLSFAGWNVVVSAGIVLMSLYGAFVRKRA